MVDVVRQAHEDAALLRRKQRSEHDRAGVRLEADVVEGEVERSLRPGQEAGHLAGHLRGTLAAVGQRP